ncbi:hypothetical protein H7U31_04935 [Olsenella uli]|nr:hypothetical protein [Olsenella uli]
MISRAACHASLSALGLSRGAATRAGITAEPWWAAISRWASLGSTSPSRGRAPAPVLRSSGTMRGVEPPMWANACTWQRSHVSPLMSSVGSTWDRRPRGGQATSRKTLEASPVAGSTSDIVGPARSTSRILPALCPTRLTTCLLTVNPR